MLDDIKKGRSYRQAKEDAQDREKVGVSNWYLLSKLI